MPIFFFFKKNFGTSMYFYKKIRQRFEFYKTISFLDLEKEQSTAFYQLLNKAFPEKLFFKNYVLLNIIFLDFSYSYRG